MVAQGAAADVILKTAKGTKEQSRCDGHAWAQRRAELFVGSTTEHVLRHATAPVLVPPPKSPGGSTKRSDRGTLKIRKVITPLDISMRTGGGDVGGVADIAA